MGSGKITWEATASTGNLKEQIGAYTAFHDRWKAAFNFHGYHTATTDNGDQTQYT